MKSSFSFILGIREILRVATWLENPYWQYFCGETYLQTEFPIDPSSLTQWRKRIGEEGVELLLSLTIVAAKQAGLIKKTSVDKVIVDTTVMPKAIAQPTDSNPKLTLGKTALCNAYKS